MAFGKGAGWNKQVKGFVAFGLVAFGASALVRVGYGVFARATTDYGARVDEEIAKQPSVAPMYAAIRANFPNEYAAYKAEIVRRLKAGEDSEAVRLYSFTFMRQFAQSRRGDMAQAPSSDLAAYRRAQVTAAEALRRQSEEMCGHFVMTGLQPSDRPSDASMAAVGRVATVQIEAAAAGRRAPANRKTADISPPDALALVRRMQRGGLSDAQLAVFTSTSGLGSAPVAEQCRIGITMLKSVSELPAEQADRLTAYFITHA